jgi:hypothetical protein
MFVAIVTEFKAPDCDTIPASLSEFSGLAFKS